MIHYNRRCCGRSSDSGIVAAAAAAAAAPVGCFRFQLLLWINKLFKTFDQRRLEGTLTPTLTAAHPRVHCPRCCSGPAPPAAQRIPSRGISWPVGRALAAAAAHTRLSLPLSCGEAARSARAVNKWERARVSGWVSGVVRGGWVS